MNSIMQITEHQESLKYVMDKHNKAKRLLFKILEERIESWWN
jgi:hypothetical protein